MSNILKVTNSSTLRRHHQQRLANTEYCKYVLFYGQFRIKDRKLFLMYGTGRKIAPRLKDKAIFRFAAIYRRNQGIIVYPQVLTSRVKKQFQIKTNKTHSVMSRFQPFVSEIVVTTSGCPNPD